MKPNCVNDVTAAPKAIGPYSQAVIAGDLVYLSGQIPLDPVSGALAQGIEAQTEQVMSNIRAILEHLKLDLSCVVKTTIFLVDLSHFATVNSIYERWFGTHRPARSTVQVAALPKGSLVEIETIALKTAAIK